MEKLGTTNTPPVADEPKATGPQLKKAALPPLSPKTPTFVEVTEPSFQGEYEVSTEHDFEALQKAANKLPPLQQQQPVAQPVEKKIIGNNLNVRPEATRPIVLKSEQKAAANANPPPTQKIIQQPIENTQEVVRQNQLLTTRQIIEYHEIDTSQPIGPKHISVDLPSKCLWYDFNDLHIRTFELEQLLKLHKGVLTDSFRLIAEAIGDTISRPVYQLTLGDFWFLMYWHRINSFPRAPFVVPFACEDDDHLEEVIAGKKSVETLKNELLIDSSTLTIDSIEDDIVPELVASQNALTEYGITLYPTTVGTFLQFRDENEGVDYIDAQVDWLSKYAMHLSPYAHGTLDQRRDVLRDKNISSDHLFSIEEYVNSVTHGVSEEFSVACKECGAKRVVYQAFDATNFFPQVHRKRTTKA